MAEMFRLPEVLSSSAEYSAAGKFSQKKKTKNKIFRCQKSSVMFDLRRLQRTWQGQMVRSLDGQLDSANKKTIRPLMRGPHEKIENTTEN